MATAKQIDQCLPQTQCTQCSYPGCREYAQAIADGEADINQCPPGGEITINALATLLDVPPKALNPQYGEHRPKQIARIVEADCIGCMLCIKACPVDAIIGANKLMHTVIEAECTGCELCLPPCPMDCIELVAPTTVNAGGSWADYSAQSTGLARQRREARLERLSNTTGQKKPKRPTDLDRKTMIEQALARSRARRK